MGLINKNGGKGIRSYSCTVCPWSAFICFIAVYIRLWQKSAQREREGNFRWKIGKLLASSVVGENISENAAKGFFIINSEESKS